MCKNLKAATSEYMKWKPICIKIRGPGGAGLRFSFGIDDRDALVEAGNRGFVRTGHVRGTSADACAVVKVGHAYLGTPRASPDLPHHGTPQPLHQRAGLIAAAQSL